MKILLFILPTFSSLGMPAYTPSSPVIIKSDPEQEFCEKNPTAEECQPVVKPTTVTESTTETEPTPSTLVYPVMVSKR